MKIYYFIFISLCTLSCVQNKTATSSDETLDLMPEPDENPTYSEAETIALKNGLLQWDQVKQLDFTFNVDRNGKVVANRSWSWQPKEDKVTLISATDTLTYDRSTMDSVALKADRGFINDKFWLLAPYQLVWDQHTSIQVTDSVMSPLSQKLSKKLTTVYSDDGGYTPGDAYDFYYGGDYIITEWVFRKGNAAEASMTTSFEGYKNFEGLNLATQHKNEDGTLSLYFTDIKVTK